MNHKIFHMASFSRSGETLVLRCLNAHPDIHVVHQINSPDDKDDFKLFRYLQRYPELEISAEEPVVKAVNPKPGARLVLKNAVWCHKYPYKGFALVRNPFSVYRSFNIENEPVKGFLHRKAQMYRWSLGIDQNIAPSISKTSNLETFCALYNRKIYDIIESGVEIIHYENFVSEPEMYLRKILHELDVPWDENVLHSHADYNEGELGHGGIKLWKPIHQGSKDSYKKVGEQDFSRIYGLTYPAFSMLGYKFIDGELFVPR